MKPDITTNITLDSTSGNISFMGKVECCSVVGFEMRFYSNDHDPPHVHLRKKGEWEITIDLQLTTESELNYTVKWPRTFKGPDAKIKRIIRLMISKNRTALISEFEEKVELL